MPDCIFCQIVHKKSPANIFWEDESHLAFLNIFPNTEGATVVITKEHYPSYIADAPERVAKDFLSAVTQVAKLLDRKLEDVGRTGIIFEGMGIDHLHAKLFPMHGTKDVATEWRAFPKPEIDTYFEKYEGYLSTHSSRERADDEVLKNLAEKLRE
jgi:diadenosine tetraphosphate (Ap4A) HIT family hydrolase